MNNLYSSPESDVALNKDDGKSSMLGNTLGETISKALLILELFFIVLPLSLLLIIGSKIIIFDMFTFYSEEIYYELLTAFVIYCALVAVPIGWYFAIKFLIKGRKSLKKDSIILFSIPVIGMLTPLLPIFHSLIKQYFNAQHENYMDTVADIAPFGIFFVIPFIHLVLEFIFSRR